YCKGEELEVMLETLKDYEANFEASNNEQKTALHQLFNNKKLNVTSTTSAIKILCNNGCPINARDKSAYQLFNAPTALFLAIHYNWPIETIELLLKKGADARIWDEEKNMNILCLATQKKKPKLIKWLLKHVYCLSEPQSIKIERRYGSLLTKESMILLTWQVDIGGLKRKSAKFNNLENYPPTKKNVT
ncbi:10693_t:CDS:2, partial [Acaulospora morrowiae]